MFLKNQRILIVGVTGKVGRMLAESLCYKNRVIGLSTYSNQQTRRWISRLPVHPVYFDVTEDPVAKLPRRVDYVFFEFAFMHGAQEDPERAWAVNVEGAARLAEYYQDVKGIIVGSTGGVYPLSRNGMDETCFPRPQGVYARTRFSQEEILRFLSRRYSIPMVFLRYFHAYTESEGFVPRLAQQILSGQSIELEEKYRNVIWQEDLVRYTIESAGLCKVDPPVFNICGPEKVNLVHLAEKIAKQLGQSVDVKVAGDRSLSLLGRSDKMMNTFGAPRVGLNEGLRRVVDSIKNNLAVSNR